MEQSILTKRAWFRRLPNGTKPHAALGMAVQQSGGVQCLLYTQQRMLDEYYPTSHDIYNKALYPDILREVEEVKVIDDGCGQPKEIVEKKKYIEEVPRTAMSYQQVIETKRTDHLTGNDVTFERNWSDNDKTLNSNYQELVDGWEQYDQEDALYQVVHQANIVADAAYVGNIYTDNFGKKQVGYNVFSFFNGDEIYCHRDQRTRRPFLFARKFTDDYGNDLCEVWDDTYYYLFAHVKDAAEATHYEFTRSVNDEDVPTGFVLDGYSLAEKTPHLYPFCPVAYHRREDGPVWVFSEDSIETYEEDFNGLRHNNKAYGEPILVTKGDDVAGIPEIDGTIKNIDMGKDDDASYLQAQSAADSYMKELDKLEELIYLQSFIVKTPELKSGDLPAAALKIIYSPAVEKAMHEVKEIQPFINQMFEIFRWGLGVVRGKTIDYSSENLPIKVYLKPFVHQSESALVADIVASCNAGVLSKQTGSERLSGYVAEESEWSRIVAERKEAEAADLLYERGLANINNHTTTTDDDL